MLAAAAVVAVVKDNTKAPSHVAVSGISRSHQHTGRRKMQQVTGAHVLILIRAVVAEAE